MVRSWPLKADRDSFYGLPGVKATGQKRYKYSLNASELHYKNCNDRYSGTYFKTKNPAIPNMVAAETVDGTEYAFSPRMSMLNLYQNSAIKSMNAKFIAIYPKEQRS